MAEAVTAALEVISLEDLTVRQRREKKDLQAKIQALKKNAPKSKRKEAMEEVARLETELEQRHAAELQASAESSAKHDDNDVVGTNDDESHTTDNNNAQTPRVSKAQKRRDKKEREAQQRDEEIRVAAEEAQYAPKAIESAKLQAALKERQLALYQVSSDGDCLYNAVRHQLQQHGLVTYSVQQLREETANFIHANKATLISFMTNTQTGELLTDEEFEKYCEAVRSTPAWGGQIELKALSAILRVPIEVIQAEGPPTIQGADEFPGPNLVITYHRLLYSLGEHYNSTQPLLDSAQSDE